MAGVSDKQLLPLAPWPGGIDNLSDETSLRRSDDGKRIIAFREGVNVDLRKSGKPQRRAGRTQQLSCAIGSSLYHEGDFPFALFIDSGTLYGWVPGSAPFAIVAGLASSEASYALAADRIFWSNNKQTGCVLTSGQNESWGVETPAGQPKLTGLPGGMAAGSYMVAITYRRGSGEESGTTRPATIDLPVEGNIQIDNIPQPLTDDVLFVRIYVSPADGATLFLAREVPVGMTSVTLSVGIRTVPLVTMFLRQMPAGQYVRFFAGRTFIAQLNQLIWSEALRPGLTHPVKNRTRYGKRITMIEPVADGADGAGLYVADDKGVYWLDGPDPAAWRSKRARAYGVVPGTSASVPGSAFGIETTIKVPYWLGQDGIACLGLPGGIIKQLDHAVSPLAEAGATLYREGNGLRQAITALRSSTDNPLAVSDRVVDKVYRNGIEVP